MVATYWRVCLVPRLWNWLLTAVETHCVFVVSLVFTRKQGYAQNERIFGLWWGCDPVAEPAQIILRCEGLVCETVCLNPHRQVHVCGSSRLVWVDGVWDYRRWECWNTGTPAAALEPRQKEKTDDGAGEGGESEALLVCSFCSESVYSRGVSVGSGQRVVCGISHAVVPCASSVCPPLPVIWLSNSLFNLLINLLFVSRHEPWHQLCPITSRPMTPSGLWTLAS